MGTNSAGTIRVAAHALLEWVAEKLARVAATGFVIWVAVFLIHWRWGIRARSGMTQTGFATLAAVIAATLAAGLIATALCFQHHRQKADARRALEMLQLNHHIRNAMQVIAYSQVRMPQADSERVTHALHRISEALRTISNVEDFLVPQLHRRLARRMKSIQPLQRALQQPRAPLVIAKIHPKPAKNT